jgi:hypothetical protein
MPYLRIYFSHVVDLLLIQENIKDKHSKIKGRGQDLVT